MFQVALLNSKFHHKSLILIVYKAQKTPVRRQLVKIFDLKIENSFYKILSCFNKLKI